LYNSKIEKIEPVKIKEEKLSEDEDKTGQASKTADIQETVNYLLPYCILACNLVQRYDNNNIMYDFDHTKM